MTYEQNKYRWLRSKLLEYQDRLISLEEGPQRPNYEEYRRILLDRLQWVWAQLGEMES